MPFTMWPRPVDSGGFCPTTCRLFHRLSADASLVEGLMLEMLAEDVRSLLRRCGARKGQSMAVVSLRPVFRGFREG
jgi:hypothetical protein